MLQAHMKFPPDYPYSPPSIRFMTKVWHPNVYEVSECTEIIDPLHTLLPPSLPPAPSVSPLVPTLSNPYVRVLPISLASLFRSSVPLLPRLCRHSRRITTVPLCPSRSVCPLYFPPSAAIAFTSIGFYIATFSACETSRSPKPPSVVASTTNANGGGRRAAMRGEEVKKKKKKKVKTIGSLLEMLHCISTYRRRGDSRNVHP